MAQPYQLVIDLGTCHTVAVVRRDGQAPRPLLFDGTPLLASGVYRDQSGALSVGRDAERLSQLDPTRFEPYPKRTVDDGEVLLGDTPTPVVDMLAALLRRVLAETADGTPRLVTLTCPADWGQQRRDILRSAARLAGLPEVRLVDEPIAAATYCAEVLGTPIPVGGCLLVFDFGGGTLDVTVVRRDPDTLRVLAVGGLDDLGGVDIDAALVGHLGQLIALRQPQAWERIVNPRSPGDQRARRAFWNDVRAAKEMLSRSASAPVQIPGTDDAIHLTREELDRVAGPLVDRAVDETRRVLGRAGIQPGSLAGILLVGGSSRMPLVASRLHHRFQIAPTVPEQPELPVAYGGLLVAWPGRTGPASPAAGPSGPVSVAPYQSAPVTGTGAPYGVPVPVTYGSAAVPAPPAAWAPGSALPPPRPPSGPLVWPGPAAAPGQPAAVPSPGWTPPPTVPAPRRFPLRGLIITVIVLAILGGLGWGGVALFGAAKHSLSNGIPGLSTGDSGGNAGSGGALQQAGTAIDLSGDGARADTAGANLVFYSASGGGKTVVHAVDPATGKDKWQQTVTLDPSEASMTVVGDLLLIDGKGSTTDGGKDMRVVLQAADGKQVQKLDWSKRADVAYLGTDAIVATTSEPYQTERVNLRTGQAVWKSTPIASIVAFHPIGAELTWTPASPANVPAPFKGFTESFGIGDRFVQVDSDSDAVQVLNTSGKTVASGKVPLDDDVNNVLWTAYDGLVIGSLNSDASAGKATLAAYRLDTLKQAWSVGLNAGDELDYVHPCGDHLVCATYTKKSDDTKAILAVNTTTGQRVTWSVNPPYGDFSTDPYWLVLGGQMLYGDGSFPPHLSCGDTGLLILNPSTGATVRTLVSGTRACAPTTEAGGGRYLAVRGLSVGIPSGTITWNVSVIDLSTGKQTDALPIGSGDSPPPDLVALAGTVMAAVGTDHKLRIATASKLS